MGPESELWVVGSPEIAKKAQVIQSEPPGQKELIDVGQTQFPFTRSKATRRKNITSAIAQENWQPLMEQSLLAEKAFVASDENLSPRAKFSSFNGLNMTVRQYTPPGWQRTLRCGHPDPRLDRIPGDHNRFMDQLYAAPISELIEPGSVNIEHPRLTGSGGF